MTDKTAKSMGGRVGSERNWVRNDVDLFNAANEILDLRRKLLEAEQTIGALWSSRNANSDALLQVSREKAMLAAELKEASGDAAILAHAYGTDNRPPTNVVVRSIERGKRALGKVL